MVHVRYKGDESVTGSKVAVQLALGFSSVKVFSQFLLHLTIILLAIIIYHKAVF